MKSKEVYYCSVFGIVTCIFIMIILFICFIKWISDNNIRLDDWLLLVYQLPFWIVLFSVCFNRVELYDDCIVVVELKSRWFWFDKYNVLYKNIEYVIVSWKSNQFFIKENGNEWEIYVAVKKHQFEKIINRLKDKWVNIVESDEGVLDMVSKRIKEGK